jgi:transposase-like protein
MADLPKKSPASLPRVPPAADGLQVNCCRNARCENFGVAASTEAVARGRPRKGTNRHGDLYRMDSAGPLTPAIRCKSCQRLWTVKSNAGIVDELARLSAYLATQPAPSCPNKACVNHGVSSDAPDAPYHRFGRTAAGAQRLRCRAPGCGRTFTVGSKPRPQARDHENKTIFMSLVAKAPIRSIAFVTGLSPETVYTKIDHVWHCCLAFAAERERRLPTMSIPRLWIGVDRQDYGVNWTDRKDKRNVQLSAIASADNLTGYVFGIHPNYDPQAEPDVVEEEAIAAGDYDGRGYPFRHHARFWLREDLTASLARKEEENRRLAETRTGGAQRLESDPVMGPVEAALLEQAARIDADWHEEAHRSRKLPDRGMQVRADYTMFAHFEFLRRQLASAGKIRFILDLDAGLRGACLAVFHREVRARNVDVLDVRVLKGTTIDHRRKVARATKQLLAAYQARMPDTSERQLRLLAVSWALHNRVIEVGPLAEPWIVHPLPTAAEPGKAIHLATDLGEYQPLHKAAIFDRASLHRVDNFFQQIRRKLSLLERPMATSSGTWRVWRGYTPYNPAMIEKILDIYRVFHNYVKLGDAERTEDGAPVAPATPAMKLGLARGPIRIEDILYFGR